VILPEGRFFNPSVTHHAAPSSSSLTPYCNTDVSDNQRHLSPEPAAQTEEDASQKGPNSVKDSQKKPWAA
ncbi:Pyranose 2-oxidase, partial [Dissostichus eleginoides]